MFLANNDPRRSGEGDGLATGHSGQQLHVSGVFIIILEVVLVVENLFPILVVALWLPPTARGVGDRLVAAFSVTCIFSALVPTPLGLASYFSGGWYGGAPTCTTYQVTSTWCNLSSLVLLTYICANCHVAVRRLANLKPPDHCPSCHRAVLSGSSAMSSIGQQAAISQTEEEGGQTREPAEEVGEKDQHQSQLLLPGQQRQVTQRERYSHSNGVKRSQKLSLGANVDPIVLDYTENSLVDVDSDEEATQWIKSSTPRTTGTEDAQKGLATKQKQFKNDNNYDTRLQDFSTVSRDQNILNPHSSYTTASASNIPEASNISLTTNSVQGFPAFNNDREGNPVQSHSSCHSGLDHHSKSEIQSNILGAGECHKKDYVSLTLFFLFSLTLGISALPVAGLGPTGMPEGEKSCRSWLVPVPEASKERVFFAAFLTMVYVCLVLGCGSGIGVCLQVSKRMKQERRRKTRLYHEEENVPDLGQLYALDCMKRHYSMACIVMAGVLTWVPSALMLTLQKAGVEVSEPTLMYSNIATSLPGLLNPLLYSLALARYRSGYKALLEKCCCKRRKLKPQPLRKVQTNPDASSENTTNVEVTIAPAGQRHHQCIHGLTNPTFNSELDQLLQIDQEEEPDENDIDDEEDEDYFPEDSDDPEQDKDESSNLNSGPVLSERTPLHAVSMSAPGAGQSIRTVLASRTVAPRHSHREGKQMNSDKEVLLLSTSTAVDDETGL
ncbi:hypothetical protein PoB_004429800 [Plakobranchus ocellatus]|uniref:G-protein coupled receptors family 1 profile domain-containing protein n=1 Tax=Plakobranchus ocellatus TaxID=259542 RepID=A0AAV4BF57_9GAST|nr:hypothetical protein PoB_004429800 [Plakobranchus ocellatus]